MGTVVCVTGITVSRGLAFGVGSFLLRRQYAYGVDMNEQRRTLFKVDGLLRAIFSFHNQLLDT